MMLPRERLVPCGGASIYSDLSTSPWKPRAGVKKPCIFVKITDKGVVLTKNQPTMVLRKKHF